jgi:hypothetical protein
MLTRIVSFYMANIPSSVLRAQAAVFAKFDQQIEQIPTSLDHGSAIDQYIMDSRFDVLIIFDIDCIPLHEHVIPEAIEIVSGRLCVYGIRQKYQGSVAGDYVGPAFICFSYQTYKALGCPSFRSIKGKADVASQLTYRAMQPGLQRFFRTRSPVEVRFLNVTDVAVPKWPLDDGMQFGTGTNYGNKVFHAFGVSADVLGRRLFLEKAAQIVGHSDWLRPTAEHLPSATTGKPPVPVYVVSLLDADGRRHKMVARLGAAAIPFRFVDAVDGRIRPVSDQIDGARVVRGRFDTGPVLARAASHRLVHRMIAEGDSDLALVLEDDAVLPDNFPQLIAAATQLNFDVLKLEGGDYDRRRELIGRIGDWTVVVRREPSRGSAAYLIRQSAAARFCNLPVLDQPIGAAFNDFRLWLRVLELEPFPVIQDGEKSHYNWHPGPRPPPWQKLVRSVRMRNRLVRLYGPRVALRMELQRFSRSFDR